MKKSFLLLSFAAFAGAAHAGIVVRPPVTAPTLGEFALIGLAVAVGVFGARWMKRNKHDK
jgi:predicted Na+-dependent transporter